MAILPSKNASSGKAGAGARFRQRKISVKVALPLYNQRELTGSELELEPSQLHHLNAGAAQQPRDVHTIETGVDKNEEDEVHLQQVINAAQRVLLGSADESKNDSKSLASSVYIPTPDASKLWKDAPRYYNDPTFTEPESYIKFSATVEDTLGVEYNMDEVDEEFFATLVKEFPKLPKKNDKKKSDKDDSSADDKTPCSALEFETLCDKFEKTIEEKQPFLSMDPSTILSFKELSSLILEEFNSSSNKDYPYLLTGSNLKYISTTTLKEKLSKELSFEPFVTTFDKDQLSTSSTRSIPKLMQLFGAPIYEHWKARKIQRKGKAITASLKFEDPNANEKDNDNDPYVCFRRREFRQARKTRRADNLGAERIRLMQKSLRRARDLVLNACKRELLKLQYWEAEYDVFKARCDAKSVKRAVGVKGDDHLFYPHKRRKIIKIEPEEEEDVEYPKTKKERKRHQESGTPAFPASKERLLNGQLQPEASSTQPYVKLPPSKIPDMDLVTVSLVLKEKNETIKRAVLEKLRKRKEHDKGYVNITYDPYQPFFNICTNDGNKNMELSHIPYSSIASSNYHQVNTTNVISDSLKKLLEEAKRPLPGTKTFSGSSGELIPSKPFPHLHTLLNDHLKSKRNSSGYIAQLLASIEKNDFSTYSKGFEKQASDTEEDNSDVSAPIFRLRKRSGRANRIFVDRRGLMHRPDDAIADWLKQEESTDDDVVMSDATSTAVNAYDSKADTIKRMDSRWRFDDDYPDFDKGIRKPFGLDPSRLNSISDDTQSIRFGSMLLSKSYDLLRESAHQRQVLMQQARMRALQQQQLNRSQGSQLGASARPNSAASAANFRRTPQGAVSQANRVGAGRVQQNYTPQQLQAMQQLRQQQQQQHQQQQQQQQNAQGSQNLQNSQYLAQKRAAGSSSVISNSSLYQGNNKYPNGVQERRTMSSTKSGN